MFALFFTAKNRVFVVQMFLRSGRLSFVHYWGSAFRIACVSSATAIKQNSNCDLLCTIPHLWSLMCSNVAAMSISLEPFVMRLRTMSIKMYVPDRPTPSLQWTMMGQERPRYDLLTFLLNSRIALVDVGTPVCGQDRKWNCVTVLVSPVCVFLR